VLVGSGWKDLSLEVEGSALRVSGTSHLTVNPIHQVAPLVAYLPDGVETLELVTKGDGWRSLCGPVEPFKRAITEDDELRKLADYVEGFRMWEADRRPLVDTDWVRKWAAVLTGRAAEAASSGDLGGIPKIRILRELSQRLGDQELYQVLTDAIEGIRSRALGLPPRPELAGLMAKLASYLELRGTSLLV
jgi:hypothetical protein